MKVQITLFIALGLTVAANAAIPEIKTETPAAVVSSGTVSSASGVLNSAEANSPEKCSALKEEIKNLRMAQSVLMKSLVQKNETLAETLDIFAKDVMGQKSSQRKSNSKKLKQAANSFRSHSVREQSLVDRFETLAQDLYARIDECLVSKSANPSQLSKTTAEQNQSPVTSQ